MPGSQGTITGTNAGILSGTNGISVTYTLTNTGNTTITCWDVIDIMESSGVVAMTSTPAALTLGSGQALNRTITVNKANIATLSLGTYRILLSIRYPDDNTAWTWLMINNAFTISQPSLPDAEVSNVVITATTT